MITLQELYDYVADLTSGVYFLYSGKGCGIDPLSRTEFNMWYGDKAETMTNLEDVFHSPFFDGRSLTEIFQEIAPTIDW